MSATLTFTGFSSIAFFALFVSSAVSFDYSSILLPVYGQDGHCAKWDLTPLASLPPANFTSGSFKYLLQVCSNITTDLPPSCKGKDPSPAYQLVGSSNCYALGKLSSILAVSCLLQPTHVATCIYCNVIVSFRSI